MEIKKHFNKKVLQEYFFIEGMIDIDCDYFIKKIKEGVKEQDSLNYRTNINGKMTSFNCFNEDKNLIEIIQKFNNYVDDNHDFQKYFLLDSWGFCVGKNEDTKFHSHSRCLWSGVIYLNDSNQTLDFPEIDIKVKPEKGKFALFSSFLEHGCKKNLTDTLKWGLSFNNQEKNSW
jgi:hypothetical protein